jgi:hypothetical protein
MDLLDLRREIARSNGAYFGDYALGLSPTNFHVEWQDLCSRYRRLILFGPIEHGKTQQLSVLRPLWELGRNPNLRIALISETSTQAVKWLARIKVNIESNARIQEVFPRLRPMLRGPRTEHWHHNSILVERDQKFHFREKDYSIEAMGVGGAIMGSRFDIAILDDTVTRRNGLTTGGRQNIVDWVREVLLGRITEGGSVWITNNAWHTDDMPHTLEREQPDVWHVVRYAAGDPNCTWPEAWSPERLVMKRQELGEVEYARQLLNVPLSEATGLLPLESIRACQAACDDPDAWWGGQYPADRFRWVTAGVDLGASDTAGANLTAMAVVGYDHDGFKHLLHLRSGRWVGRELLEQVVDLHRKMRPREWLVESNAAQNHLVNLIGDPLLVEAAGATRDEARSIRVFGQYTGVQAKRSEAAWSIRGMGSDFDAKRWRLPKGKREVEELIREMGSYSFNDHAGDRLMALWLADCRLRGLGTAVHFKARSA